MSQFWKIKCLNIKQHLILPRAYYKRLKLFLLVFSFFYIFLHTFDLRSQEVSNCDGVPITLSIEHLGQTELPSYICGEEVYFSISDLFTFLGIKNENSATEIEGFVENQHDLFFIEKLEGKVVYKGDEFTLLKEDYITTPSMFFLSSDNITKIFGIESLVDKRNLSAALQIGFELPAIKAARRRNLQKKIQKGQKTFIADTTIGREEPLFHFGTTNYNFSSYQQSNGWSDFYHLNIDNGGLLLGGEWQTKLNLSSHYNFSWQNQYYKWRYVNNKNHWWRQASIGKISHSSVSTISSPVVGVQITNSTTNVKKSFGTYQLSDYTKPGWVVELYINNVLVDYQRADSSGFYSFDVPLMYGKTEINLRQYGPWGEEEVSYKNFNIPFNFLPDGNLEYNLDAGVVEDQDRSHYFHGKINYGVSKGVTIGGGLEYVSSLEKTPLLPYLQSSIRFPQNILFSGEYIFNVGYNGNISYSSPSNYQLELQYTRYLKDQEAVYHNYLEERKAMFSFPIRSEKLSAISRFNYRQHLYRGHSNTYLQWLLSGNILGVRMNLTNTAFFTNYSKPQILGRLSNSFMALKNTTISPNIEFDYLQKQLVTVTGDIRYNIFQNTYLHAVYNYNFRMDKFQINLGVRYNLPFTRLALSSRINKNNTIFSQNIGGNIEYEPIDDDFIFNNYASIGRGGIKFKPFLDENDNDKKEPFEIEIEGLNIHSSDRGVKEQIPGGATIFSGLEPYIDYYFELDTKKLERIAWQLKHKTIQVQVNPNQIRVIPVPVKVVGEVAGFVNFGNEGIGGIRVNIFDAEGNRVNDVLTASDGYFSYLGLPSGEYVARVDKEQLEKLNLQVNGDFPFSIHNTREGDYVDNLEFFLSEAEEDLQENGSEGQQNAEKLSEEEKLSEATENSSALSEETAEKAIFEAVSEEKTSAGKAATEEKLQTQKEGLVYRVQFLTSKNAIFEGDPDFKGLRHVITEKSAAGYRYVWGETRLPGEAAALQNELRRSGFEDAYVVHYYNGERIPVAEAVGIRSGNSQVGVEPAGVTSEEIGKPQSTPSAEELEFRVQIAASKVKMELTDGRFHDLHGVEEYRHEGMFKYSLGSFRSFGEANQFKNVLRAQGFADAFVVPFQKGHRLERGQARGRIYLKDAGLKGIGGISLKLFDASKELISTILSEADGSFVTPKLEPGSYVLRLEEKALQNTGMKAEASQMRFSIEEEDRLQHTPIEFFLLPEHEPTAPSTGKTGEGLVFKVQVLASVPKLAVTHPLLKGLEGVERYKHNGMYKYTVGESNKLEAIRQVRREVLKKGFEDAFIVAFLNGNRINLQEMRGQVLLLSGEEQQGLEGISIRIFDRGGQSVTGLVSNADGKFSFLGLKPGVYTASLDEAQLEKLGLESDQLSREFEIERNREGSINQVLFRLKKKKEQHDREEEENTGVEYRVQLAASNVPLGPNHYTLKGIENVNMYKHNGMFKYTVGTTRSLAEARELLKELKSYGKINLFIVGFKEDKRILVVE